MFFDGSNIVLDMEWMEVLPGHPNNPYSKAHQSKEGRIILEYLINRQGLLEKEIKAGKVIHNTLITTYGLKINNHIRHLGEIL